MIPRLLIVTVSAALALIAVVSFDQIGNNNSAEISEIIESLSDKNTEDNKRDDQKAQIIESVVKNAPVPTIIPIVTATFTPSPQPTAIQNRSTSNPTPTPTQPPPTATPFVNSTPFPTPVVTLTPFPTSTPSQYQPTPLPQVEPTPTTSHIFYTSSHSRAKFYYCDTDSQWKGLSEKYLQTFSSEAELLAQYDRVLHKECKD